MKIKSIKELKERIKKTSGIERRVLRDALEFSDDFSDVLDYLKLAAKDSYDIFHSVLYDMNSLDFYDNYEYDIERLLNDYQRRVGFANRFEAIASLGGAEDVDNIMGEKDLLVRFAYEETARKILRKYFDIE